MSYGVQHAGTEHEIAVTTNLSSVIARVSASSAIGNILCGNFTTSSADNVYLHQTDNIIAVGTTGIISIYSSAYIGKTTNEIKTLLSGVYLYYELATPIETDISSYLGDKHIPIEANGSLTFTNTYNQAVPSSITYDCGLIEVVKTNHEHDIEQQKDIDTLKETKQDRLYLHHIVIGCDDSIVKGIKFKLLRRNDTPLTLTDLRNESITEVKAFDRVTQIYLNNRNYYSPIDTLQFYDTSETLAFNVGYSSQASNGILDTDNVEVAVTDVTSVTDTVTPL